MTFAKLRYAIAGACMALAACGGAGPDAVDDTHGVATDPNAATGFYTGQTALPKTASDSRGDGVMRDADGRPYRHGLLGARLPAVSGPLHGGGMFRFGDIDQWTVVYVWGMWCGDCLRDAPNTQDLAARLEADPSIAFISVHTPPSAARADEAYGKFASLDDYFGQKGYTLPTVIDADASLRGALEIAWTPTFLLVSPDGIVRGFRTDLGVAGETPVDDFLADARAVIAEVEAGAVWPAFTADDAPGAILFTAAAVERAFPGAVVVSDVLGEPAEPVFRVLAPDTGEALFELTALFDAGHVRAVTTRNGRIAGPNGESIGEARLADHAGGLERCDGRDDGTIVCTSPDGARIWVYAPAAPAPDTPVAEQGEARLVEMVRILPGPGGG